MAKVDDDDQFAAIQTSWTEAPLERAQDADTPLVECALRPSGTWTHLTEYASLMASTIHLEMVDLVTAFLLDPGP